MCQFYVVEIRRVSITIHKESFQKVTHHVNVNSNKALDWVVIKISYFRYTWYKDGRVVATAPSNPKSHRVILPTGSLFFLNVRQSKKEQVKQLSRVTNLFASCKNVYIFKFCSCVC